MIHYIIEWNNGAKESIYGSNYINALRLNGITSEMEHNIIDYKIKLFNTLQSKRQSNILLPFKYYIMSYFDDLENMVFYKSRRYYNFKEVLSKAERKLIKPLLKKIDTEISNAREKGNKELTINVGDIENHIKELLIKYYRSKYYKVATWITKDNMTEIYLKRKY